MIGIPPRWHQKPRKVPAAQEAIAVQEAMLMQEAQEAMAVKKAQEAMALHARLLAELWGESGFLAVLCA